MSLPATRIQQAYRVCLGEPVPPFNDPVGRAQILGRDLAVLQEDVLKELGLELASSPPVGPHLRFSDRTFFTEGLVHRVLAQLLPGQRLLVDNPAFLELTQALQSLPSPGVYEIGIGVGEGGFEELVPTLVELDFVVTPPDKNHPALAHALPRAVPSSDACVHQIEHWSHILRVNWLAMASTIERERRRFQRANVVVKAGKLAGVLWRAKGLTHAKIARGLSSIGPDCDIHPSAVVEASVLGAGVRVGPFSVVRGAVLGEGVQIEEHAICNASVLGVGARVGRRGMVNLCVLYPGAFVSNGRGHQASVFGRDSFTAETVMIYDLSFGGEVKVWRDGERVGSGTYFLGAAIGHRARLGAEVILGYGSEVPNDAFVVGPAHNVLRKWGGGPGPHRVEGGVAVSCSAETGTQKAPE